MEKKLYSQLRQEGRQKLSEMIPLAMPYSLFVDTTNYCNFKCKFCPRSFSDYQALVGDYCHMDLTLYEKMAEEIHQWGKLKSLKLYYLGEPFLNPNIIPMLKLSIDYQLSDRIEITSNGSALTQDMIENLLRVAKQFQGRLYLRFSIYSADQKRHGELTQSSVSIDKIRDNIYNLKKLRDIEGATNVHLYAKMIDTFSDENNKFLAMYRPIVDEVCIEPPMNWSGYDNRSLLSNIYSKGVVDELSLQPIKRKACSYPFYNLVINSDGSVVCCCVDWSRKTLVGNLNNESLRDIWFGKNLHDFQMKHLRGLRSDNSACCNCAILHDLPEMDSVDMVDANQYHDRCIEMFNNHIL